MSGSLPNTAFNAINLKKIKKLYLVKLIVAKHLGDKYKDKDLVLQFHILL